MAQHGPAPKPWYRAGKDAWYAQVDGRQVRLARGRQGRQEALLALHRLLAQPDAQGTPGGPPGPPGCELSGRDVLNLFLSHVLALVESGERAQVTYHRYRDLTRPLAGPLTTIPATELRPHHVQAVLQRTSWGPTTRAHAVAAIKAATRWAWRSGHLGADPLAGLAKPRAKRREQTLTAEQAAQLVAQAGSSPFGHLLRFLHSTGARPGEAYTLTAQGVDLERGRVNVRNKTRGSTGEATRAVYLTPEAAELVASLAARWPDGPIFRNRTGRPWTRNAVALAFRRLAQRSGLPPGLSVYSLRHLWITDALERGVPVATVAELVGHTTPAMVMRVYSRLGERAAYLREQAGRVRAG